MALGYGISTLSRPIMAGCRALAAGPRRPLHRPAGKGGPDRAERRDHRRIHKNGPTWPAPSVSIAPWTRWGRFSARALALFCSGFSTTITGRSSGSRRRRRSLPSFYLRFHQGKAAAPAAAAGRPKLTFSHFDCDSAVLYRDCDGLRPGEFERRLPDPPGAAGRHPGRS